MAIKTLINGKETDQISFLDRGLQYGDGLFETIAVEEGELLCWDDHFYRLQQGCERLNILSPDQNILKAETSQLVDSVDCGIIKIIVTRGQGHRGYSTAGTTEPTRIVSLFPWPEYSNENSTSGINVRVCDYRYAQNPVLAGIKHLNRLEQILARSEWDDDSIAEGIVLDQMNNVIEGTMSNLFYVTNKSLNTPDLSYSGVEGIIRNKIIEIAPSIDIDINIKKTSLEELKNADEIFMCNSIIGLWPVKAINEIAYEQGEIAVKIKQALKEKKFISKLC
jgi:4-amino-4-deoxychorismate lyase